MEVQLNAETRFDMSSSQAGNGSSLQPSALICCFVHFKAENAVYEGNCVVDALASLREEEDVS